jgi:hypothetical protein
VASPKTCAAVIRPRRPFLAASVLASFPEQSNTQIFTSLAAGDCVAIRMPGEVADDIDVVERVRALTPSC